MKKRKKLKIIDLDVDYIGGERTPTEEDFALISAYIRARKAEIAAQAAAAAEAKRQKRKETQAKKQL